MVALEDRVLDAAALGWRYREELGIDGAATPKDTRRLANHLAKRLTVAQAGGPLSWVTSRFGFSAIYLKEAETDDGTALALVRMIGMALLTDPMVFTGDTDMETFKAWEALRPERDAVISAFAEGFLIPEEGVRC